MHAFVQKSYLRVAFVMLPVHTMGKGGCMLTLTVPFFFVLFRWPHLMAQ